MIVALKEALDACIINSPENNLTGAVSANYHTGIANIKRRTPSQKMQRQRYQENHLQDVAFAARQTYVSVVNRNPPMREIERSGLRMLCHF